MKLKKYFNFFLFGLLSLAFSNAYSQVSTYGNEWIDSQKNHYKFKVGENGLYRITYAQLSNLGLHNIPVNQLRVFRDGEQVPLYISNTTLGPGDYIEFYGRMADGKVDQQLFLQPQFQANEELNLLTDTAVYFLTHRDTGIPLRVTAENNVIPSPEPSSAEYIFATALTQANIRSVTILGESYSNAQYFNTSDFTAATGYSYFNALNRAINFRGSGTKLDAGVDARLYIHLSNSQQNRNQNDFELLLNNNLIFDTAYVGTYDLLKLQIDVPLSFLNASQYQTFRLTDTESRKAIYLLKFVYPRNVNLTGNDALFFNFSLSANSPFLDLGFNTSQGNPVLYNLDDHKRYVGVVQGNRVKFNLGNESTEKNYFISSVQKMSEIDDFELTDMAFNTQVLNADYIILSNSDYIGKSPNYIQDYATYRSSEQGGSHEVAIVNAEDLYNQFAYGHNMHASAIKNFLAFAQAQNNQKIKHLFIVGKGLKFDRMYSYLNNPSAYSYIPIPTYGSPGSDNLLSAFDKRIPTIPTGRLSSWSNEELGQYLQKVQQYESEVKFKEEEAYSPDALWQKTALHVAGSSDQSLQAFLISSLNNAGTKYKNGQKGGVVYNVRKTSTDPIEQAENEAINNYFNAGINLLTFFGHASSAGFDYNLNNPDLYDAIPRFPHFLALGCDVANIFTLTQDKTIGETYLNSIEGGSLTMIASNNYGYTSSLDRYMQGFYNQMTDLEYGETIGTQYLKNIQSMQQQYPTRFMDAHIQSILLQGDPGLTFSQPVKPDLAILEDQVRTEESFITLSLEELKLIIPLYNFGKSVEDSILVLVSRQAMGEEEALKDSIWIDNLYATDTLHVSLPLSKHNVGMNNISIHIDADNRYEELTKGNNIIQKQVFVASDDINPIYPHDFGIVYDTETFALKASTMNTFASEATYLFEIDTTQTFDSPLKQTTSMSSEGGTLIWKPTINFQDSMVYYWRVAVDIEEKNWHYRSFIYLEEGSDGWNQSHYYQYKSDKFVGTDLPEETREFERASFLSRYLIENKVISSVTKDYHNTRHSLNDIVLDNWGCAYSGGVHIAVFDSISGEPWQWQPNTVPGSLPRCNGGPDRFLHEFYLNTLESRNQAAAFINSIPDGNYIMIKNITYSPLWDGNTAEVWKNDTLVNGSNQSLYHSIVGLGFDEIDEYDAKKAFILFRKKGDNTHPVYQLFSENDLDKIMLEIDLPMFMDSGRVESVLVGPAKTWTDLSWKMDEYINGDVSYLQIYGLNNDDTTFIQDVQSESQSLTHLDANQFPYLMLKWVSKNTLTRDSRQLKHWRVMYEPLPEIGLSPNYHFTFTDSLNQGEKGKLSLALHSLSDQNMDSVGFRIKVLDEQLQSHVLSYNKFRPLLAHDTMHVDLELDLTNYPGRNTLIFEANPNLEQPEQFYPNNIGQKQIYVHKDDSNPLIDVTFDGVYILDKDIVSAKPEITILLKDDNIHLPINDTAQFSLYIQRPNQTNLEEIQVDDQICKFYPAEISGNQSKNEARIEYTPHFLEDGVYKLIAKAKDKLGNEAGRGQAYEIRFTVINKSTITNVLNYPNPFSTSTQFVFTLTGAEIPSQFKIQILSVTGKVVREITQNELGPIRVGRNVTEFKWDGRDEHGQMLGNGVYLYRAVTNIKGEGIEHRGNEQIDQFFKNGYGKLYIMR